MGFPPTEKDWLEGDRLGFIRVVCHTPLPQLGTDALTRSSDVSVRALLSYLTSEVDTTVLNELSSHASTVFIVF